MKIILFDIDGTLISTAGAGIAAMNRAYQTLFGLGNALDGISIAGCTDSSISNDIFKRFKIPKKPDSIEAIQNLYFSYLNEELHHHDRNTNLLPGFPSLLNQLRKKPDVHLGLLTGNWQGGARIKLRYFGLWDYFRFGAFADDHHDRNELLPFALRRLRTIKGYSGKKHRVFVVGDTPRDVHCGKPYGAVTIAVATGPYSRECLREENPHYVFDNLANIKEFLKLIESQNIILKKSSSNDSNNKE